MKSFAVNLMMTITWMILQQTPSVDGFIIGYSLGFGAIYLFPTVMSSENYIRRTLGLLRFTALFLVAFIQANLSVASIVLTRRRAAIKPGIFDYPVDDLRPMEKILLAHLITLTPGTISIDLHSDGSGIAVHVLDFKDVTEEAASITHYLKEPMLRFTR